jgi:hypothetical protein
MLDPRGVDDYAAYFDRAGRTIFETNDPSFVSQAWASDNAHVCVLRGSGGQLITRTPGQPDRTEPVGLTTDDSVDACNLGSDVVVADSSQRLSVLRPSSGKLVGSLSTGDVVLASADASYVALESNGAQPVVISKTSHLSAPVTQLDASLVPIAFSGDDSLLLTVPGDGGTSLQAIAWRTGKTAWTYDLGGDSIDSTVARPSSGDFVVHLISGASVLIRRDGTRRSFG